MTGPHDSLCFCVECLGAPRLENDDADREEDDPEHERDWSDILKEEYQRELGGSD